MKPSSEKGMFSAMYLVFLVTLGLMGIGGYVLVKSEGLNVGNSGEAMQAEYAVTGAVYYAMARLEVGALDEGQALNIGGATVTLDTSTVNGDIMLRVSATLNDKTVTNEVELSNSGGDGPAVYATGSVNDIIAQDSAGVVDHSMIVENASAMPTIDYAGLDALGNNSGLGLSPAYDPGFGGYHPYNNWPHGSFYQWDGVTPNVTHVPGNLYIDVNVTLHGIIIVDGDLLEIHNNHTFYIDGILILTNPSAAVEFDKRSTSGLQVNGGVVVNGTLNGHGFFNSTVRHKPEYMRCLSNYVDDWGAYGGLAISRWSVY